jgi:hypothetical protein
VQGAGGKQSADRLDSDEKVVCLDFDGVLHSYTSPWTSSEEIHDGPTPGAFEFVGSAIDAGYTVVVQSARANSPEGKTAIEAWMREHGAEAWMQEGRVRVTNQKPGASVYIDDRGFRFSGTFPTVDEIESLHPWNRPPQ